MIVIKVYTSETPHDDSATCACGECIKKNGNSLVLKVAKEQFPWQTDKEPQFHHIAYELRGFGDGYCYVDKNIKVW